MEKTETIIVTKSILKRVLKPLSISERKECFEEARLLEMLIQNKPLPTEGLEFDPNPEKLAYLKFSLLVKYRGGLIFLDAFINQGGKEAVNKILNNDLPDMEWGIAWKAMVFVAAVIILKIEFGPDESWVYDDIIVQ